MVASGWAHILHKGPGLSRKQSLELYERDLLANAELMACLPGLEGLKLMCRCTPSQRCHGDVMIQVFNSLKSSSLASASAPPPTDTEAREAADAKKALAKQDRVGQVTRARQKPTKVGGAGEPIMIGHGDTRRLLADSAGLCSPGLWPPAKRFKPTGVAKQIHDALIYELGRFESTLPAGLGSVLGDLASGRLKVDPFPAACDPAASRLRAGDHRAAQDVTPSRPPPSTSAHRCPVVRQRTPCLR